MSSKRAQTTSSDFYGSVHRSPLPDDWMNFQRWVIFACQTMGHIEFSIPSRRQLNSIQTFQKDHPLCFCVKKTCKKLRKRKSVMRLCVISNMSLRVCLLSVCCCAPVVSSEKGRRLFCQETFSLDHLITSCIFQQHPHIIIHYTSIRSHIFSFRNREYQLPHQRTTYLFLTSRNFSLVSTRKLDKQIVW